MSDDKTPPPGPGTSNWVKITNVYPGDCLGLSAQVWVDYSNAMTVNLNVGLDCGGAASPPDISVGPGTGTLKFLLVHTAAASGHTVTAKLKQRFSVITSDSISPVGIGNPCPLSISGIGEIAAGFPSLSLQKPLSGTFDQRLGDGVLVMVEVPSPVEYPPVPPPQLVFAAPAEVDVSGKEGLWTHPAIKVAKKGNLLRVVLTRGGEVVTNVRAIFV